MRSLLPTLVHSWWTAPALGAIVALGGLIQGGWTAPERMAAVLVVGLAVALSRLRAGFALGVGLVGATASVFAFAGLPPVAVIVGAVIVGFSSAVYGDPLTRWISVCVLVVAGVVAAIPVYRVVVNGAWEVPGAYSSSEIAMILSLGMGLVVSVSLSTMLLVAPWGLGLLAAPRAGIGAPGVGIARVPRGLHPLTRANGRFDTGLGIAALLSGVAYVGLGAGSDILTAALFSTALVLRRASPLGALAVAWIAAILQMVLLQTPAPIDVVVFVVLYSTASYGSRPTRLAGLVSSVAGALVAAAYLSARRESDGSPYLDASGYVDGSSTVGLIVTFILFVAVLGLSWTAGLLLRTVRIGRETRSAQLQAEAERRSAETAVVELQERNRIARDMHDVVAHSLAVVIAQADGARYLRTTDPESVDVALTTISGVARDALGDVRQLLAQLRHSAPAGPQPEFDDVPALLDRFRQAGLPIRPSTTGVRGDLGQAAGIAAYRILQEALTNALRHGDPSHPVDVRTEWTADRLSLVVMNAIRPVPRSTGALPLGAPGGAGHGLAGMRERAALVGGSVEAGVVADGFRVAALLPVRPTTGRSEPVLESMTPPASDAPSPVSDTQEPIS